MLFSSLTFIVFFLPAVLAITALLGRRQGETAALVFLIMASCLFYAWAYPPHLLLLGASIAVNFTIGQRLAREPDRVILWAGVAFNLGLLGWFKYAGFLSESLGAISGAQFHLTGIVLPLAISFFTFQQIAYLVDISRGEVKPAGFLKYVFFVSFFPQLIAGPIVHFRQLVPQLGGGRFARFLSTDLAAGALLFALGLGKKVLVADNLRHGADRIFEAAAVGVEPSFLEAWTGMFCYGFQIYFDFSGYSDMALGLGRMFGLKLPVNFFSPYKAASIIDFWHRWNITLSHFLRDYLYIPLGGNRRGRIMRYANLFIVMLLGGLWHGANWTFFVWGGLHGAYLTINHAWRWLGAPALPRPLGIGLTFIAATVAWVFFRADSFADAWMIFEAMAGLSQAQTLSLSLLKEFTWLPLLLAAAGAIVWTMPNAVEIVRRFEEEGFSLTHERVVVTCAGSLAAFSLFSVYSAGSYEFLYFQF